MFLVELFDRLLGLAERAELWMRLDVDQAVLLGSKNIRIGLEVQNIDVRVAASICCLVVLVSGARHRRQLRPNLITLLHELLVYLRQVLLLICWQFVAATRAIKAAAVELYLIEIL